MCTLCGLVQCRYNNNAARMDVQRNCPSTAYFLPILVGAATAYAWPTLNVTEGEGEKEYCTYSILTFLRIRMKG